MTIEHNPSLRRLLEKTAAEHKLSMKDLTVLSPQVDPFRLDTPTNHQAGAWLANAAATLAFTPPCGSGSTAPRSPHPRPASSGCHPPR